MKSCEQPTRTRYGISILAIVVFSSMFVVAGASQGHLRESRLTVNNSGVIDEEFNNSQMRIVQEEELKRKKGEDDEEVIWLSILGRVYDVSAGREYYGPGAGYCGLAARDASVNFATGNFAEEVKDLPSETLNAEQLADIDEWRDFYLKEEKYPFVGFLEGTYYDEIGNPTEELKQIDIILDEYKKVVSVKKLARKKEREERLKKKKTTK